VIKLLSVLVNAGFDLLAQVVLKYRRVQLAATDVELQQQVGIQVKCPMSWIQLQMGLCASNGLLILAIGTLKYR
jgi:hypothetical protein